MLKIQDGRQLCSKPRFRRASIFYVLMNMITGFISYLEIHYTRIPLKYQGLRHVVQSKQSLVHMKFFTAVTQNLDSGAMTTSWPIYILALGLSSADTHSLYAQFQWETAYQAQPSS